MSTKASISYFEYNDVLFHVYKNLANDSYFIEMRDGESCLTFTITKKMADAFAAACKERENEFERLFTLKVNHREEIQKLEKKLKEKESPREYTYFVSNIPTERFFTI